MAKNNQNPSKINAYNPLMRKTIKEDSRREKRQKYMQRYSMNKQVKEKIKAILSIGLAVGSIGSIVAAISGPTVDTPNITTATTAPKKEESYAIALPSNNATITVDGEDYTIDKNSFVIVSGDNAIAYDEDGNIHKGQVNEDDFKEVMEITADEMSNYTIYQVIVDSGVNVRSTSSIEDGNIISTVEYQDYVLGYRAQTPEKGDEWISTLSTDGETIYEGYIREDLLQEITISENEYNLSQENLENLMIVNTSEVENSPLNLRTQPDESDKRTIMTQIPNGSTVNIIGETITSGNREWSQIEYKTDDGYVFQGWVATAYLTPYLTQNQSQEQLPTQEPSENISEESRSTESTEVIETTQATNPIKETEEPQASESTVTTEESQFTEPPEMTEESMATEPIIDETKINASGNITGIDISGIDADDLRELLQTGIPESVNSALLENNVDSSQIAGDINFVYIKLGASPHGYGNFQPVEYDAYIKQVKVCEELGIPYGFYYYSTSITVEEAKIELEYIKQSIEDLRETLDLEHNKLEIVVDIELSDANDRQYRGNIEEQTEAKAALINGIQEEGLSDNVLIYGPIRVMRPDLDRIIDLSYLHSLLTNPDDVALWMCSPSYTAGKISSDVQEDIAYAKEQGFSTVAHQVVLDSTVIGRIDINNMNLEHFQKLLSSESSLGDISYSSQINNSDNER